MGTLGSADIWTDYPGPVATAVHKSLPFDGNVPRDTFKFSLILLQRWGGIIQFTPRAVERLTISNCIIGDLIWNQAPSWAQPDATVREATLDWNSEGEKLDQKTIHQQKTRRSTASLWHHISIARADFLTGAGRHAPHSTCEQLSTDCNWWEPPICGKGDLVLSFIKHASSNVGCRYTGQVYSGSTTPWLLSQY